MSDLYDTHEQGERVKNWLKENGSAIVMGLVLAFGLMFGFKQFQSWETSKRQQASAEFQTMVVLIEQGNMDGAVPNYEVLKSEFPNSAYTSMAAMMMAKARLNAGQPDLAISALNYAMENAKPEPLRIVARERLARIKLSEGDTSAAMALLDGAPSDLGFESLFDEARGDIHLANGDTDLAIKSYQSSLASLEEGVGNRQLLVIKLEALGAMADDNASIEEDAGGGEM